MSIVNAQAQGMGPSAKVFSLPELLGKILPFVEQSTLLHLQRVNRMFRDFISNSNECQRALFFLSTDGSGSDGVEVRMNELLKAKFQPWWKDGVEDRDPWRLGASWWDRHGIHLENLSALELTKPGRNDAYLRPEASWRKMLVSQPPVKHIGITYRVEHPSDGIPGAALYGAVFSAQQSSSDDEQLNPRAYYMPLEEVTHLNDNDGELRMGLFYDLVEEALCKDSKALSAHIFWSLKKQVPPGSSIRIEVVNDAAHAPLSNPAFHRQVPDFHWPMGGFKANEAWIAKYRSRAYREVNLSWPMEAACFSVAPQCSNEEHRRLRDIRMGYGRRRN